MRNSLILWLLFWMVSVGWAADRLDPDTLWDWRNVAAPKVSPDGARVVYQLEWADRINDAFYSNLWVVGVDGKEHRPLTEGSYRDTGAVWSPDGRRLAYLSNRSGKTQIWMRWMESGAETKLTELENSPGDLSWSPDGQRLGFMMRVAAKPGWSVKSTPAPRGAKWAEGPSAVTRLKWRADGVGGAGLLAEGFQHFFVIGAEGGAVRQVTSGDFAHAGPGSWTPDSKNVVMSAARRADADGILYPEDLFSIDVASGTAKALVERKGAESDPIVSPDGKWVAFLGFEDQGKSSHSARLWVVGSDGQGLKLLGSSLDRNYLSPLWKADSSGLYVLVESEGQSHVHFASLKGTVERLTSGNWRYGTAYGQGDKMSLAPNQTLAVSASNPQQGKDLFILNLARGEAPKRITNVNAGLLEGKKIGQTQEVKWKSFDGRPMQGWVITPPDFVAGKQYPLILDIHGGPHAMYGVEFNHQMQMFASRGFVVFYCNPRGSTGYGEEFGDVIHGKYPGDDYQDLMTGVDAVLAQGFVDPKRLYVTGGSGGGLLTAWIVTKTDRFRAAVSQYPVSNWFTQAGSADIGLLMTRWMKAMPWENPKQYIERSPVFFADKVKTPTMVLTGEEDWRTPIAQSEEFYFALKVRGVDTVLVRFPKEPHGIRGAFPSHRILKVEHILGWFESHAN